MNILLAQLAVETILKANLADTNKKDFGNHIIPFLTSVPGIGKSSVISQVCKKNNWHLEVLVAASMDSVELSGFPMLNKEKKTYERAKPFFLDQPTDKPVVLFLDEISQSSTPVFNSLAMLVNERRLSEHKLPDNVVIVCAGNRVADRAGVNPMPTHLRDRLTYIPVEPDLTTFLEYANTLELDHRILGFLRHRPDFLSNFDPQLDSCPSPRSWIRTNTILGYNTTPEIERALVTGQVGEGAQADFLGYLEVANEMPDPQEVLQGRHKEVPENPTVLYALCAALSTFVTGKTVSNFIKYIDSFPNKEFSAFTIRDAINRNPKLKTNPHITAWFLSSGKELLL